MGCGGLWKHTNEVEERGPQLPGPLMKPGARFLYAEPCRYRTRTLYAEQSRGEGGKEKTNAAAGESATDHAALCVIKVASEGWKFY